MAALCRQEIIDAGIESEKLRFELGLSELGEWMNFRIYLPEEYKFTDAHGHTLDLRLECFNSVDGSSRLVILFGWFRLVCSNGLIIGDTRIEIRERHGNNLDIASIPQRIRQALEIVKADRVRMQAWQTANVAMAEMANWANSKVTELWGKKAAARVFHICETGKDVEFTNPFAPGKATEKPVSYLGQVPGCMKRAKTKYDVSQVLSFVATHRRNAEEQIDMQVDIPHLLERLEQA